MLIDKPIYYYAIKVQDKGGEGSIQLMCQPPQIWTGEKNWYLYQHVHTLGLSPRRNMDKIAPVSHPLRDSKDCMILSR